MTVELSPKPEEVVKKYNRAVKIHEKLKRHDSSRRMVDDAKFLIRQAIRGESRHQQIARAQSDVENELRKAKHYSEDNLPELKRLAKRDAKDKDKTIELIEDMPRRKRKFVEYQHLRSEIRDLLAPRMDEYQRQASDTDASDHLYWEFNREGTDELSKFHMLIMPYTDPRDGKPAFEGRFLEDFPEDKPHEDHGSFIFSNFVLSGLDKWECEDHEFRAAERVVEALKDDSISYDGIIKQSELSARSKK